jgi:hypothetical protein
VTKPRSNSKSGLAAIARVRSIATAASKKSTSAKPTLIEIPSDSDSDIEFIASRPANRTYKPVSKTDPDSDVELVSSKPLASLAKASSATSKRARDERKSQLKALAVRAQKGLLSEDEKVQYATLRAMDAKKGGKGGSDGCVAA